MESVNTVSNKVENFITPFLKNTYLMAALKIVLVLYSAQLAPATPVFLQKLFSNSIVKIIAVALIAYISNVDFQLAVVGAVAFVVGMNVLSGRSMFENFADYNPNYTPTPGFVLLEPNSNVYPNCVDVKMSDLLALFGGDRTKLAKSVSDSYVYLLNNTSDDAKTALVNTAHAIGLPYNLEFNDDTAPYIATILMYNNFYTPGSKCSPPQ